MKTTLALSVLLAVALAGCSSATTSEAPDGQVSRYQSPGREFSVAIPPGAAVEHTRAGQGVDATFFADGEGRVYAIRWFDRRPETPSIDVLAAQVEVGGPLLEKSIRAGAHGRELRTVGLNEGAYSPVGRPRDLIDAMSVFHTTDHVWQVTAGIPLPTLGPDTNAAALVAEAKALLEAFLATLDVKR